VTYRQLTSCRLGHRLLRRQSKVIWARAVWRRQLLTKSFWRSSDFSPSSSVHSIEQRRCLALEGSWAIVAKNPASLRSGSEEMSGRYSRSPFSFRFDPFRVVLVICGPPWALPTAINFHAFSVRFKPYRVATRHNITFTVSPEYRNIDSHICLILWRSQTPS